MKTALVTGITGQDGSYLAELLLDKGYKVIGVKRRTSLISTDRIDHLINNENFILVYGNLNDSGCMHRLLLEHKPDEIYNLAAQSHVRVSFETPEETTEFVALGTLRLLEAYRNICPEAKFYQASSSEMFGDNPEHPQSETTRLTPASPYACAKVYAHNLCRNYRESYGLHISSGILFNHESPRRGETFVTRKITRAAARIKMGLQDKLYLGKNPQWTNFDDTSAIVQNMDYIISIDTSLIHLAGALNKRAFLLLSKPADWRWSHEKLNSPKWYENITIIRQKKKNDWGEPMEEIKKTLIRN